jgi:hypothetical protein
VFGAGRVAVVVLSVSTTLIRVASPRVREVPSLVVTLMVPMVVVPTVVVLSTLISASPQPVTAPTRAAAQARAPPRVNRPMIFFAISSFCR